MGISPYAAIVIGSKNMLMKVYEISGGKGFRTVDEIRYEYELGKEVTRRTSVHHLVVKGRATHS